MKTNRMLFALMGCAIFAGALAQETAQPEMTAEQVIEKNIEVTGGRAAYEKQKSLVMKGTIEFVGQGLGGPLATYQKAPNKVYTTFTLGQVGEIIQAFDGKIAWSKDPIQGLRKLQGAERDRMEREASNALLNWKTAYKSVTLEGKVKVEDRDAYKIVLTPKKGKPSSQYFDAETFLVVKSDSTQESEQGTMSMEAFLSDYRVVDGVKMPFKTRMVLAQGEMVVTITEAKSNVAIPDSKFAYPAAKPVPVKKKTGTKTGAKTGTTNK